ncbi:DUF2970 domain-containing protein [Sinimarinibacterium flocculans]|uniref:DUF2970 domain-containing protein n=1 Tax=Sinimarinibacterium flocculans TaxID=985250 RepID=UPI0035182C32
MTHDSERREARVGVLTTIGSVLSAFFGVQSSRARQRDFSHGSPALFAAVAGGLTLAFAATLALVVRILVATTAGG